MKKIISQFLILATLFNFGTAFAAEYMVNFEVYPKGKVMAEKKGKRNISPDESLKLDVDRVEMEAKLSGNSELSFVFTTKNDKDKKVIISSIPATPFSGDFSHVIEGQESLKKFGLEKIYVRIRNL